MRIFFLTVNSTVDNSSGKFNVSETKFDRVDFKLINIVFKE